MIEGLAGSVLLGYLSPVALFTAAICLLVLRAGASRVFFDIVGTFQATKMIKDADSAATVFEALHLDAITGIQEAGQELGEIFNGLTDAMVPIAREFQEAAIQLDKFLQVGEDLETVRTEVENIGLEFAFSGDQAMEAAAKMAQISGVLGPGSLATGTQIGMEFGLISGMETEAAMQRMINLQQQTQFMTQNLKDNMSAEQRANIIRRDSIQVLDELNTIENRSAATMEQITFVMNQFASQAHLANEEIRSMAALSAVMIETGEEQGKGGRALRMMYARLGSNIGGARDEMERLGVAVTDAEGNMRPLSVMLKELEAGFKAQSGAEQQATAQIIAGNRHYTRFLKLITNLDRVRQLEVESAMRLFPAMEEIDRRRDSELFKLEQAEAGVRKYSAALGEALLPTMTSVTEKQSQFLAVLSEMVAGGGPLGQLIGGFLSLSKHFSTIVGPAVSLIIAFKSFSISMQTQLAVMRALNKEQVTNNTTLMQTSKLTSDQILLYSILEQKEKDLALAKKIKQTLSEYEGTTLEQTNIKLTQQNARLSKNAGLRAIYKDRIAANTQEIEKNNAALEKLHGAEFRAAKQHEVNMINARQQAASFSRMTMLMGGAGTAMMVFSKNQKMMKAGVLLNTAAIVAQIIQMGIKMKSQIKNTFATTQNTMAVKTQTVAIKGKTAATVADTAATNANTAGQVGMAAAIGRGALQMGALGVAAYLAVSIFDRFTKSAKDAKDATEELTQAQADLANVMGLLQSEGFDEQTAKANIAAQQEIIDTTMQMAKSMGRELTTLEQERVNAASQIIKENEEALSQLHAMTAAKKVLAAEEKDLVRFAQLYHASNKKGLEGVQALQELGFANLGVGGTGRAKVQAELDTYLDMFGPHSKNIANIMKESGFDAEAAAHSIQSYLDTMEGQMGAGVVDTFTDSVEVANKTLTEFTNAREEMFHGFRADNLTGDLVRQVQQQGVETLITSTEVVMTNVFNGMTIPEMADLLIEEIEIRGRANGFNVTANVA